LGLDEIEHAVLAKASKIMAPGELLPTYGRSEDMARPHVEVEGDQLFLVVRERGQEQERRSTGDLDQLLYWIFEGVTFSMAAEWELAHRDEQQDFRRLLFQKQIELLHDLDPAWAERLRREHQSLLRRPGM
jgi:hypothetical protein